MQKNFFAYLYPKKSCKSFVPCLKKTRHCRLRPFLMKKLKMNNFLIILVLLGYKVNISLLTEKLPYFQICGTKVGPPCKKRRLSGSSFIGGMILMAALIAIGYFGMQFYRARNPNYRTL